jgi:hypothetical protein
VRLTARRVALLVAGIQQLLSIRGGEKSKELIIR